MKSYRSADDLGVQTSPLTAGISQPLWTATGDSPVCARQARPLSAFGSSLLNRRGVPQEIDGFRHLLQVRIVHDPRAVHDGDTVLPQELGVGGPTGQEI